MNGAALHGTVSVSGRRARSQRRRLHYAVERAAQETFGGAGDCCAERLDEILRAASEPRVLSRARPAFVRRRRPFSCRLGADHDADVHAVRGAPARAGTRVAQFYGLRATVSAGSRYFVASVPQTSVAYTEVFTSINAKSVFVACRVLNEEARDATVTTDTGDVRIPARTARWVKAALVVLSHRTTPTTARVSIDRCEVTGLGAGTPAPASPRVPPEVARARHAGARLGKALRAASAAPAPAPLPSGPVASGITLSAQQPTQAGATLTVSNTWERRLRACRG